MWNHKACVPVLTLPVIADGSWASPFSSLNLKSTSQQWKHWVLTIALAGNSQIQAWFWRLGWEKKREYKIAEIFWILITCRDNTVTERYVSGGLAARRSKANEQARLVETKVCFISDAGSCRVADTVQRLAPTPPSLNKQGWEHLWTELGGGYMQKQHSHL